MSHFCVSPSTCVYQGKIPFTYFPLPGFHSKVERDELLFESHLFNKYISEIFSLCFVMGMLLFVCLKFGLGFLDVFSVTQESTCLWIHLIFAVCSAVSHTSKNSWHYHSHRQWPRLHITALMTVVSHKGSCSLLCCIDIQMQQRQVAWPLWQSHTLPVFILNALIATVLHKHTARATLPWLTILPHN